MKSHGTLRLLLALGVLAAAAGLGRAALAPGVVSPGEMAGYNLLYAVDDNNFDFNDAYTVDNSATFAPGSFLRVGYYVELGGNWVWVSMDTFNADPTMLGVPKAGTNIVENGTLVSNLNIETNHPNVTPGTGKNGIIEFWASNYNANGGGAYGSNDGRFDWKDSGGSTGGGHGSFQIFERPTATTGKTLFGITANGGSGIGDQPTGEPDWTFGPGTGSYTTRNLEIWLYSFMPDELTWDGVANGNFNSTTQWTGGPPSTPDATILARIGPLGTNNTVTVTGNDAAYQVDITGSGALIIGAGNTLDVARQINAAGRPVTLEAGATLNVSGGDIGTMTTTGNATVGNSGLLSVDTLNVAGASTFTKNGAGTLLLSNSNNYTGQTNVNDGIVRLGNNAALGTEAGKTVIQPGGTLDIAGFRAGASGNELVEVAGAGAGGIGAIINSGAAQTAAFRRITLTGDTTLRADSRWDIRNSGGAATLDMAGFDITKVGGSELAIVSATVSNPGNVNVNQGLFRLESSTVYTAPGKTITVANGATLDFWNSSATHNPNVTLQGGANLTANGGGGPTLSGTVTLNGTANVTTNNNITISGLLTGGGDLQKAGGARLVLQNAGNNFTGALNVNAGTLSASSQAALGAPASGVNVNGGTLEISGWDLTAKPVSIAGQGAGNAGALNSINGNNTITQAIDVAASAAIGSGTAGNTLTINAAINMPLSGDLTFTGPGNIVVTQGFGNGGTPATFNLLQGFAYDVTGNNGDNRLDEIGNNGANSLLAASPISRILIDGSDRIDYRDDNDFRNGDAGLQAQGFAVSLDGLAGLNQNDNFATAFSGQVNIPDLNSGAAYDVEFGTNRADDPAQIYVDLDQDGVFEANGAGELDGERVVDRPCCGNSYNTVSIAPGTYDYLAVQLERAGGSQIEPTIDLTPDALGRRTVQPGQQGGLFTTILTPDNGVIKTGTGTTTFAGANTYGGTTSIKEGTLIAANASALGFTDGTAASGTSVAGGATLALQGGIAIGDEHLTLAAGGATIRNISGNNSMATQNVVVRDSSDAADQVTIQTDAGSFVLGASGNFDLNFSQLNVDGAGDTTISQKISAQPIGSGVPAVIGIQETIWDAANTGLISSGNVTDDIEQVRLAAAGPLGANDAQGVLTTHLHYNDDGSVDTRADALGAPGFDAGDFTMLWTTQFTPNENGNWGFRNNNVDDRYSFWIDLSQDGTFQSDERFWVRTSCCAGSGDRLISEATSAIDSLNAGDTYLLGFVMNDTGGGGYFRDMEFKAPSGTWLNLDPSASSFFNLVAPLAAPTQYHLIKNGAGTLRLTGDNDYDGQTLVTAGTLLIDGTTSGQGTYTVQSGATLGGGGTIGLAAGESVTFEPGSILAPGTSVGTLGIDGDLTLQDNTTYVWELGPAGNDVVDVTGTLTLDGWTLQLVDDGGEAHAFDRLYLFTGFNDLDLSAGSGVNFNATIDPSLVTDWWEYTDPAGLWIGQDTHGLYLGGLQTVPEPSTLVLAALGLLGLGLFGWRRKKGK